MNRARANEWRARARQAERQLRRVTAENQRLKSQRDRPTSQVLEVLTLEYGHLLDAADPDEVVEPAARDPHELCGPASLTARPTQRGPKGLRVETVLLGMPEHAPDQWVQDEGLVGDGTG